jgi:hypothetical protein
VVSTRAPVLTFKVRRHDDTDARNASARAPILTFKVQNMKETGMDKDEAKKKITADAEARTKAREGKTAEGSKPTPTQEENDLAAMGVPTFPLEADGSPVEGGAKDEPHKTRNMESSGSGAGYSTRQARTSPQHTPHSSS